MAMCAGLHQIRKCNKHKAINYLQAAVFFSSVAFEHDQSMLRGIWWRRVISLAWWSGPFNGHNSQPRHPSITLPHT